MMANFLCSVVIAILAVELMSRLPIATTARRIARAGSRTVRTIFSPAISDHWKEKALLFQARRIACQSLHLGSHVLMVAAACALPIMAGHALGLQTLAYIVSLWGILVVTGLAIGYAFAKTRFL
jgi:hypothetical protein